MGLQNPHMYIHNKFGYFLLIYFMSILLLDQTEKLKRVEGSVFLLHAIIQKRDSSVLDILQTFLFSVFHPYIQNYVSANNHHQQQQIPNPFPGLTQ